jgi:hypothetical protein
MPDYASALWIPNSNYFANTGKKRFLILHATAGGSSAENIAAYFQGTEATTNPVSSHYVVGKDGTVVQCIDEKDGAYGNGVVTSAAWAGNPNLYTISIEHVKSSTDNSEPLTPAQQMASFALIKDICIRNGIGMHDADERTGITGHFAIDPINRARCPGNFDWQALWNYLGGNTMAIPSGWTDDGAILKAPDGTPVKLGFRDHILSSNWDPNNVPLEPEQHLVNVELSNASLGPGQAQTFRWKRLAYTPKTGMYESWLGQELVWYQKAYAKLQTQNSLLQSQVADLENQLSTNTLAQENAALLAKIEQAQKDLS